MGSRAQVEECVLKRSYLKQQGRKKDSEIIKRLLGFLAFEGHFIDTLYFLRDLGGTISLKVEECGGLNGTSGE